MVIGLFCVYGGEFDIKKKRSKFNVDTTKKGERNRTYDNIVFDSILEMQYYRDVICEGIKNGSIKKCERQVTFELQPKCVYKGKTILPINYVADFVVTYTDDSVVVVDTKGLPDQSSKIKKKMFHYRYPDINYIWVGYVKKYGGWLEYHEIERLRNENKKANKAKKSKV